MIPPPSSPQHLHLLCMAIAAALACTAPAALARSAGPIIADGTQQDAAPGDYASTGEGAAGYVFHALNGGGIRADGPFTVTASGHNTAAVRAERDGTMRLNGGSITTHGDYAIGLSIKTGGQVDLLPDGAGQGMVFFTSGYRSPAIEVDGGTLRVRDAVIDTTGYQSHGMASYYNGHIDGDGLTITTREAGSVGVVATAGGTLTLTNSAIETLANAAHGVVGGKAIILRDTRIRVAGRSIAVDFQGGTMWMENGALRADHAQGTALRLAAGSQVDIIGTRMDAGSIGLSNGSRNGQARLVDVDIRTFGTGGAGIWLGSGPSVSLLGGSITTVGDDSRGIDNFGGGVTLDGVHVSTTGASAHGLNTTWEIHSADLRLEADRIRVDTGGDGAIGALSHSGGIAHLRDSTIATTGANSYGVLSGGTGVMTLRDTHVSTEGLGAVAAVINANGSLDIDGGSLTSARDAAFWVRSARHVAARNGARLIGGSGTLMNVDAAFASPFDVSLDQDVYAQGDIAISPEDIAAGIPVLADIRVHLNGRSHWRGASSVVNQVALGDGSRWTLTGDSIVGQLDLRDSTLALSALGATGFNRLTVDGDLDTRNALLIFNGALGGDDSPVDTLHVRGDTRGTAGIQVNNVQGLGGQTINGIALIQVDGASEAVYHLRGRAVAGQYDYFLHKGAVSRPDDGGWYLRSALPTTPPEPCDVDPDGAGCVTPPDPCDSDPAGPGCIVIPTDPCDANPDALGCGITPPDPCALDPEGPGCALPPTPCEAENTDSCHRPRPPQILRPEAGAYLANQAAAVTLFQHRLHDRDGAYGRDDARGAGWLRVTSTQTRQDVAGQLALKGRASTLMSGMDMLHWGGTRQGRAGVLLAAGQASNEVRSQLSGYTATGNVKGTAVGVYASWMQHPDTENGTYVDGWLQHGRYRNSVQGIGLARERQDARTNAVSLETGYAWKLRVRDSATLRVQPQLQLTYTDYRADDLVEHNGTQVATGAAGGLSSRLGVRVMGDVRSADHRVQPFMSAHWLRESGSHSVWMDDVRIDGGAPSDRYELRGGAMLQLGMRWSAWADLGLRRGDGDYRSVSAQMGVKADW